MDRWLSVCNAGPPNGGRGWQAVGGIGMRLMRLHVEVEATKKRCMHSNSTGEMSWQRHRIYTLWCCRRRGGAVVKW